MSFSFSTSVVPTAIRSHNPSYFYQTPSGYIFRLKIPKDLKILVGRVEFRYSLKTGSLRIAKRRVLSIVSFIHRLFSRIRKNNMSLTQEKINDLVRKYIHKTLQEDEQAKEVSKI